jgi:hypothetical protein
MENNKSSIKITNIQGGGVPAFEVLRSTINYGPEMMQSAAGCYHTSLTQQVIPVDATDVSAGTAILQRRKEGKRKNNQ